MLRSFAHFYRDVIGVYQHYCVTDKHRRRQGGSWAPSRSTAATDSN